MKAHERLNYMGRYRDSLMWAAFELQRRLYSILYGHEILRRDIQFLNIGNDSANRRSMRLILRIRGTFGSGTRTEDENFRLFRMHQRAIGEIMIAPDSTPGERRCLGYSEFCHKVQHEPEFRRWFEEIFQHVDQTAQAPETAIDCLTRLQHQLIDLIEQRSRFSQKPSPTEPSPARIRARPEGSYLVSSDHQRSSPPPSRDAWGR